MNKINHAVCGAAVGIFIWVIMTVCDFIDEYVLSQDSFLGFIACFAVPLLLSVIYIVSYLKNKPSLKNVLLWFLGFLLCSIISAIAICSMVDCNNYIIDNSPCCQFICLNGIEYYIYAFLSIAGFALISIIFHIIHAIAKYFSKKKGN